MHSSFNSDLFPNNPFNLRDLEGTEIGRRTIFESQRPDFLRTGQQQRIFSSMFDNIVNEFLGQIGQDFQVGRPPSTDLTSFLTNRDLARQFRREGGGRQTSPLVSAANFLFDR